MGRVLAAYVAPDAISVVFNSRVGEGSAPPIGWRGRGLAPATMCSPGTRSRSGVPRRSGSSARKPALSIASRMCGALSRLAAVANGYLAGGFYKPARAAQRSITFSLTGPGFVVVLGEGSRGARMRDEGKRFVWARHDGLPRSAAGPSYFGNATSLSSRAPAPCASTFVWSVSAPPESAPHWQRFRGCALSPVIAMVSPNRSPHRGAAIAPGYVSAVSRQHRAQLGSGTPTCCCF